jgi:hypothetical protein
MSPSVLGRKGFGGGIWEREREQRTLNVYLFWFLVGLGFELRALLLELQLQFILLWSLWG